MKKYFYESLMITACIGLIVFSCKKKKTEEPEPAPAAAVNENYSSITDFHSRNEVKKETFNFSASSGGTFVTTKGTTISIPANAFMTTSNTAVSGTVTLEFKDIYKKSDMLLSDVPTVNSTGELLKSGGEFWINATTPSNSTLKVRPSKPLSIKQPFGTFAQDTGMKPFILGLDLNNNPQWNINNNSAANPNFVANVVVPTSTTTSINHYVFTLYGNLSNSASNAGTWCNSDNPNYFQAYTQSTVTIHSSTDLSGYQTDVFLVFKNQNCMIHVYKALTTNNDFPYKYAPVGLECTMVAVAVKNGNVYSSFVPITISANQTVNFTLSATTTDDFKAAVNALN